MATVSDRLRPSSALKAPEATPVPRPADGVETVWASGKTGSVELAQAALLLWASVPLLHWMDAVVGTPAAIVWVASALLLGSGFVLLRRASERVEIDSVELRLRGLGSERRVMLSAITRVRHAPQHVRWKLWRLTAADAVILIETGGETLPLPPRPELARALERRLSWLEPRLDEVAERAHHPAQERAWAAGQIDNLLGALAVWLAALGLDALVVDPELRLWLVVATVVAVAALAGVLSRALLGATPAVWLLGLEEEGARTRPWRAWWRRRMEVAMKARESHATFRSTRSHVPLSWRRLFVFGLAGLAAFLPISVLAVNVTLVAVLAYAQEGLLVDPGAVRVAALPPEHTGSLRLGEGVILLPRAWLEDASVRVTDTALVAVHAKQRLRLSPPAPVEPILVDDGLGIEAVDRPPLRGRHPPRWQPLRPPPDGIDPDGDAASRTSLPLR